MAIAIALWCLEVRPGDPQVITLPADLRITNVALSDELADLESRTTLKISYRTPGGQAESDDEDDVEENQSAQLSTSVLCSLTPGKIEQATIDMTLSEDEEYLFEVVGKNTLYLTGNYIDQHPVDEEPYSDEEEEDFDLREVSSDVEIDPEELDVPSDEEEDAEFEEIVDEAPAKEATKKRPRESDATEADEKLSKSQKKKQKKQKGENGQAVEPPAEKKEKKEKAEKEKPKAEAKTVEGGVQIKDHKIGTGPVAKSGQKVTVRYIGKLQNGKIFDQNTKGKGFMFTLGKGEVIKGWDIGVAGMAVGGERLLTIPALMAYGKRAQQGIPANSTLIFEVKLLSIK